MSEFEAIERLIREFGELAEGGCIVTGPGDDAAIVALSEGEQVVLSVDTLVPDVHFPRDAHGDLVGYRAVAVSVSDLAAMGARPLGLTVALTVKSLDTAWLELFADGVAVAAKEFGLKILGGNLARGPLNISVSVQGSVPAGQALLRSGAQAGDDIWVSGTLGATLAYLRQPTLPDESIEALLAARDQQAEARYFLPHPRLELGEKIRGLATAAIDISDGFASEIRHVTSASDCGARVELSRLPVWPTLEPMDGIKADDSYELLFTANQAHREQVLSVAHELRTPIVCVGEIIADRTVEFLLEGKQVTPAAGFDHFA